MELLTETAQSALLDGVQVVGSDRLLLRAQPMSVTAALPPADADPEPADPDLLEARWQALRAEKAGPDQYLAWSAECQAVVAAARELAASRELAWVGKAHLVEAALTTSDSRAVALCAAAGLDPEKVLRPVEAAGDLGASGTPYLTLINMLSATRVIASNDPWLARAAAKVIGRVMSAAGGAVPRLLEAEALRQAVRAGSPVVNTAHVVLAVRSLDEQITLAGERFAPAHLPFNKLDIVRPVTLEAARRLPVDLEPELLTRPEAEKRFTGGGSPADPLWTRDAERAFGKAGELARQRGDAEVGAAHLLAAVVADPQSAASRLFAECGVDPATVRLN